MGMHSLWKAASTGCVCLFMALLPGVAIAQWVQLGADLDGEASWDDSGWSVSLSADGSRVAIGAAQNDGNGIDSGHVRVFQWVSPNWVQLGSDIDGEAEGDLCGTSVALSADGSRLAVGAPENDGSGHEAGHVRVYEWFKWTSTWLQVGSDIDGESSYDESGWSVSLSADGSRVAIGAPNNEGNEGYPGYSGHVRVYQWVDPNWVQLGSDIDGEAVHGGFGSSVSLSADGSRLAVGAPYADGNGTDSGHVRVYEWFKWTSTWLSLGSEIGGEGEGDESGFSVSLAADGSRVAIGDPKNDAGGGAAGRVRVFEYVSPHWYQLGSPIVGETLINKFGTSVSLSEDGSYVAAGAPENDGGGGALRGHVRVHGWAEPDWIQLGPDIDGEADSNFSGWSVSLSADGSRVAVGAPYNTGSDTRSGHVRVFLNVLFADGFESGDCTKWSSAVGELP